MSLANGSGALVDGSCEFVAGPTSDAACSSGPSPTTLHLIGPGKVGRALLRELADLPVRVVAVSDTTDTVFAREGLDAPALAQWKEAGHPIAAHPQAANVPLEVALSVFSADVVVDCTDSNLAPAARAASAARATALVRAGRRLVLAAKTPLLGATDELLIAAQSGRVGLNAVFGGAGRAFVRELATLRDSATGATSLACTPNGTTTAILVALERGSLFEQGCQWARALGLLERDPAQDLDGRDAALKLALIASAWLGRRFEPDSVARPDVRALDPKLLIERRNAGATTRLVGRATRDGELSLAYEAVAPGSSLAVPPSHVSYAFALPSGATRVFLGDGLGPQKTARALVTDIAAHLTSAVFGAKRRVAA
jgi:homoserine dehydrogenase